MISNELNFYTHKHTVNIKEHKEENKNYNNKKETNKYELYLSRTGKEFDRRSKFEIFNDLNQSNSRISLVVPPSLYLDGDKINITIEKKIFPLSAKSNSTTIFCNENGYFSIFESDRNGFNNPDDVWDKDVDYILIGDSFVHGACVNRPNDIGSKIRKKTNKNVLNLGYSGNGPLLEYATIKEYFKKGTKYLVWFFYERNDLAELENEKTSSFLLNYIKNNEFNQKLVSRQNDIDQMSDDFIRIEENKIKFNEKNNNKEIKINITKTVQKKKVSEFQNLLIVKFFKLYHLRKILFDNDKIDFKEIIKSAKKFSELNNAEFFVYLPEYRRYTQKNFNNNTYIKIKKLINELNINFIDIHEEFIKTSDPLQFFPFRSGGHYTIEGYDLIANKLSEVSN